MNATTFSLIDHNGNTPLIKFVSQNDARGVLQILSNANITAHSSDRMGMLSRTNFAGETALHIAASRGLEKICALLLRFGANPNMQTLEGLTPLHLAALNGHRLCAKVLVAFGAQPNVADLEGDRPAHWAVRGSQAASLPTLVNLGCDIEARNADGETVLDFAVGNKDRACVQALLALGATSSSPRSIIEQQPISCTEKTTSPFAYETLLSLKSCEARGNLFNNHRRESVRMRWVD